MQTKTEVLDFCNYVTFHDHINIERLLELNHVRECVISMLSKCDVIPAKKIITVLSVIDGISIMIIDKIVETLVQEINI